MNVNEKGVKGLIKVLDDLSDKNYLLFPAFDDHSPVDLIVMTRKGQIIRLQIKYRSGKFTSTKCKYEVPLYSVVNGKKIQIDRSIIDGYAVYLADHKIIKYIPIQYMDDVQWCKCIYPDDEFELMENWVSGRNQ